MTSKKFYWSGLKNGTVIKGNIDAQTLFEARNLLTAQHIKIRYIYQKRNQKLNLKIKQQVLLFKQLSTLLTAQISLLKTLHIIETTANNLVIKKLMQLSIEKLQQGQSITIIFNYLDPFCLQLLLIGEKTGKLDQAFEKISTTIEKKWLIKKNIIKTLSYPTILFVVSMLILIGLLIWVVPQFQKIFAEFHAELPLPTLLLIASSNFLLNHFLLVVSVIFGLSSLSLKLLKNSSFTSYLEKISFKLPIISTLKQHHYAFQFFLGTKLLFEAGMSITDALTTVRNSMDSVYFKNIINNIILNLKQGCSLYDALMLSSFFPIICIQMINVAEETGELEQIFNYLTHYHQQQFSDYLATLQQLLEPAIMLIISIFVGLLLFSLYLPIFKLGSIV